MVFVSQVDHLLNNLVGRPIGMGFWDWFLMFKAILTFISVGIALQTE